MASSAQTGCQSISDDRRSSAAPLREEPSGARLS
ncbi:hypothetical protein FHS88_004055 [Roseomonas alkaliterrae]|uniref:Uncharacterized protein n=1 Tax=Neoroseomonas alkaliterrae TaxID=1452450 RepID=A0A840YDC1_9PROT|nr:hypothetical protein [Neoroseomonas alkaliterrae]